MARKIKFIHIVGRNNGNVVVCNYILSGFMNGLVVWQLFYY